MSSHYPIKKAEFLISAMTASQFPEPDRPEIAFAGRSNVGKSTLINGILQRKKLARTSRTPGRTQAINFFDINDELYFVDLPGYGYAKVPMKIRAAWKPMVESYLMAERDLRAVVVLVDIRRDPKEEELNLVEWLNQAGVPPLIVLTKSDKIKRSQHRARVAAIKKSLFMDDEPFMYSAISGDGRAEIKDTLIEFCDLG